MTIDTIDDFLAYLERVRQRTRRVAERIPAQRIEEPPREGAFTAGDLVRHIAATERWMWAENAKGRPSRYPGHGSDLAEGKEEVLGYLDRMHEEAVEIFRSLSPEDLRAKCATVGGVDITVWKWLRAMLEHEIHHRGQLYAVLAGMGVETPPLYGLTEAQVRAASEG